MVMTPIPVYYPVNGDFIDTSKNPSKRYAVLEKNSDGLYIAVVPPKEYPGFSNDGVVRVHGRHFHSEDQLNNPAAYGLAEDFATFIIRQPDRAPFQQFAISSANIDLE